MLAGGMGGGMGSALRGFGTGLGGGASFSAMNRGLGGNASMSANVGGKASLSDMLNQYDGGNQSGFKGGRGAGGVASNYFTCTVGQKPSKAKFFLHDVEEVSELFDALKTTVAATMASPDWGGPRMNMRDRDVLHNQYAMQMGSIQPGGGIPNRAE